MSGGAKVIDFEEAAKRLGRKGKIEEKTLAIARIEKVNRVSPEEIERALQENPELELLRQKGIDIPHISAWLERFPAMSLQELIGILKYAVREVKEGGNDKIIDYLFQPLTSE